MNTDFEQLAIEYHQSLPGLVRATLNDSGVSNAVIDHHQIGWDDECIAVPVRNASGSVVLFEKWQDVGVPVEELGHIELFPWAAVKRQPPFATYCEGIHEALVVESCGVPAICATGSGRYYKARAWQGDLEKISLLIVALKKGSRRDRRKGRLSRAEVEAKILSSLSNARSISWHDEVKDDSGAAAYAACGGSVRDWLLTHAPPHA